MKILCVCQYYYPENFVITKICEGLVSFGHDVTVLTCKPNYGYNKILEEYKDVDEENLNGVKVIRLTVKPRQKSRISIISNYLSYWKKSKKWVKKTKEKFDIVYSMSLSPVTILAAGNLYKKKHNVKHIVHCVDLWPESVLATKALRKSSLAYKILYVWSKKLYKRADEILLGSPSFEEYFKNVLKIKDMKYSYVPQCSLIESTNEVKSYGKGFNILYCGNIGLLQHVEDIPEIMSLVNNKNISFHIIGMGPKSGELEENINKFKSDVIYYGPIPSKKAVEYVSGADAIYVYLADNGYVGKTIPNKLEMAMCFAKPILGVLSGDGKKVIEDAQCGFVVNNDFHAIAEAIEKFGNMDKSDIKALGDNSKRYYDNTFSYNAMIKNINDSLTNR